jgi:hypothetical protein
MLSKLNILYDQIPPWLRQSHFEARCSTSGYWLVQMNIFPLKLLISTIANIEWNKTMMTVMFKMFGIANKRPLTATLRPSFFPISLRDLRILKVLTTLKLSAQWVRQR